MSQKKVAIGIDLGTTKCCVGVVRDGKVEILENERSRKTTPSYVAFTDTERLVGEDAKDQATLNPTNTIFGVKGIIGRDPKDSNVTKAITEMPYKIVNDAGNTCINVTYEGEKEVLLPQQVTAMLLTKMKDLAQNRLGCSVEDAVISVPASFSNAQRQATKDAATIAGLKVLALINEPTAAAIAHQANRQEKGEETIAVVDFGGGKFEVAIVSVNSASVSVKALSGTTDLGGNNVDEILMAHVQEEFRKRFSRDPPMGVTVLERLRSACVKLKNSLSLLPRVQDRLDCFGDECLLPISINRENFEDMLVNNIQSSLRTHFDQALKISGLDIQAISRVVLVGGSTRIPLVPAEILKYSGGSKFDRSVNPDEAIAQGAAIYAALLIGDHTVAELVVVDILPNSFCSATQGCSDMLDIFSNRMSIPTTTRHPVNEKARCRKIELFEELYGRRNPHRLIGTLCLSDEFNKSARLITEVVFEINQCGIFDVVIQLGPSSDPSYIFRDVVKDYSARLNSESLQTYIARELQFRLDEKEERDRVEAYTSLESCCFRLQDAMETTEGKQHFPDLVEQIKTVAGETIDWLDAEVIASKSDCRTKLKSLKKLERKFMEEIYRLKKFEQERADAENALKLLFYRVQTFLSNTNVSDEEEKADAVREQLGLVGEGFQLGTIPSKADCDEKRVALENAVSTLERALEVRRQEEERQASVIELQEYCSDLVTKVTKTSFDEADLQLVKMLSDQAKDILQWLESNHKMASIDECIQRRNSLEEKIKTQQRRAEQRAQERAAELEKERGKLVTSLWNRCQSLCASMQSSTIGMVDAALHKYISGQVDEVMARHKEAGRNMSKTECDEALELISNLGGLFSTWHKDREEKVRQQKLEKERAEAAARREMERAEAVKKAEKEQAEAQTNIEKERVEAAKEIKHERLEAVKNIEKEQAEAQTNIEKERVEAAKEIKHERLEAAKNIEKEQAEAATNIDKELTETKNIDQNQEEAARKDVQEKAETTKKFEKKQAKVSKRKEKEQAETAKKEMKEQAEYAKRLDKEESATVKKLEKDRTEALQNFETKWANLESTLSMDALKEAEPVLVDQAFHYAKQTSLWLKTPGSFCLDQYKERLETLKKFGQDLQSKDQQLRANSADVDGGDSDIEVLDAESESETQHNKSSCLLM